MNKTFIEGVINQIIDPVFVKNSDFKFIFVNDSTCSFFGYEREELIGKTDFDFFPEKEASIYRNNDISVLESGLSNINEENFIDANEKEFHISTKKSLYKDESGQKFIAVIIRDISNLKKAELHQLDSIERLEKFAYMASHDLKSPLRTINSFTHLLEVELSSSISKKAKGYLKYIKNSTTTALTLVSDLLGYAVLGDSTLELQNIDLNELVDNVKANLSYQITENNTTFSHQPLPTVVGNKTKVYQLFQNLLSNAIKFSNNREKPIINIESILIGNSYHISITDNGIGIEEYNIPIIFDLLTKLNAEHVYKGSGIGLATCKKIISSHNWEIRVQSKINEGTRFTIVVPIKDSASI